MFLMKHGNKCAKHHLLNKLVTCGLDAAVFPRGTQAAVTSQWDITLPLVMPNQPLSPWRMNRAELLVALDALQIPVHPKWTLPELRQTLIEQTRASVDDTPTAMKGISKLSVAQLKSRCAEEGVNLPESPTRGLMIKLLREKVQPDGEQVVTFGKYKSWMYKEVPETYLTWAIKETKANPNSGEELVRLANWAKAELEKRATLARVRGSLPVEEDPEVKATITPPPMSAAASSASWSVVGSAYTSQRGRSAPFPKRDAAAMDPAQMAVMDLELPEEAQSELLRLETEMALIRQKYQQSKETSK